MTLSTHEYDVVVFIAERVRNKFTINNIKPLNFTTPALVMAARTARRTMYHDWAFRASDQYSEGLAFKP